MEEIIIIKKNGIVDVVDPNSETIEDFKTKKAVHMCWHNCSNAFTTKCPKIQDEIKKMINEYDFITDGFQIINSKGQIDRFVVTKCLNYIKEKPKTYTVAEKERLNNIKKGLRMAYFDASTLEEAYLIQHQLEQRGDITNIRGYKPSKDKIKRLLSK